MNPLEFVVLAFESVVQTVGVRAGVEQPQYRTVLKDGVLELREYAPRIVAETTVRGGQEEARNAGFRKVAAYIFGANRDRQDVAMTAPVAQQKSRQIAMTAPVVQATRQDAWTIQFTMLAKYSLTTLPEPSDPDVHLRQEPAARYAVVRFSGSRSGAAVAAQNQVLLSEIQRRGWTTKTAPVAWFYDPPWTLPPLRRNEVAVLVE
jgi:hypothetical protein